MSAREAPIHDSITQDTALLFQTMRNTARVFCNQVSNEQREIKTCHDVPSTTSSAWLLAGAAGR